MSYLTPKQRPLLLSVVQYQDCLESGEMTVPQIIAKVQEFGADGIELRPGHGLGEDAAAILATKAAAEAAGLLVTYATFSTLLNTTDEGRDTFRRDIETARDLGAIQLRVFQGLASEASPADWDDARAALDLAAAQNVRIALENSGDGPGAACAEIAATLDKLPHLNLFTNIDIGNYAKHGEDVVHAIRTVGARAASTHLKDLPSPPETIPTYMGAGTLPLEAIFDAFTALSQPILHCFEFVGGRDPDACIRASIAFMREYQGEGRTLSGVAAKILNNAL